MGVPRNRGVTTGRIRGPSQVDDERAAEPGEYEPGSYSGGRGTGNEHLLKERLGPPTRSGSGAADRIFGRHSNSTRPDGSRHRYGPEPARQDLCRRRFDYATNDDYWILK